MQRVLIQNTYPVLMEEIAKADTPLRNVDEIIASLRERVLADRGIALIGVFDHYGHSVHLNGAIRPEVQDAKQIVFCFGPALPEIELMALQPRAIGVADLGNRFFISFMEGPNAETNHVLADWVDELRTPARP